MSQVKTLLQKLAAAREAIPVGSKWKHYKGGTYVITDLAIIELTLEVAVIYLSVEHPTVKFIRPLVVWQETVEWEGEKVFRFRALGGAR